MKSICFSIFKYILWKYFYSYLYFLIFFESICICICICTQKRANIHLWIQLLINFNLKLFINFIKSHSPGARSSRRSRAPDGWRGRARSPARWCPVRASSSGGSPPKFACQSAIAKMRFLINFKALFARRFGIQNAIFKSEKWQN